MVWGDHMEVKLEVNTANVDAALAAVQQKVESLAPLMATLAEQLYTITDESFDAQRSPDGSAWVDLAPATWRYKQTPKKLYESGTLRDSLYAQSNEHEAVVGVNASSGGFQYGLSHQFGSSKRHIPARPFLPIDRHGDLMSQTEAELIETIMEYFKI